MFGRRTAANEAAIKDLEARVTAIEAMLPFALAGVPLRTEAMVDQVLRRPGITDDEARAALDLMLRFVAEATVMREKAAHHAASP